MVNTASLFAQGLMAGMRYNKVPAPCVLDDDNARPQVACPGGAQGAPAPQPQTPISGFLLGGGGGGRWGPTPPQSG